MEKPKITVIIPFYKVKKYFERCLNSIVNQTFKDIEIILIDDFGNDGSLEIAEKFAQKDSRIKIVKNDKNKGQGYSRNLGVEMAESEYIAFVDADDWLEPQMYQKLMNRAIETDADIVNCNFRYVYKNRKEPYALDYICPDMTKIYNAYDYPQKILGEFITAVWNGIYKKSLLMDNKIKFMKTRFEDNTFCWEARIYAKKMAFIPDILYNYEKTNPNSDTYTMKYCAALLFNCKKLKEIIGKEERFQYALFVFAMMCLEFTFSKVSIFHRKKIFYDYHEFFKDFDESFFTMPEKFTCYAHKLHYIYLGDYKRYNDKNIINKIKRTIKYAI